jgi:hypothetical protein
LSTFVEEVVFTLHPSFQNPIKTVTSPPFEVTEVGWGEFEAGIKIVFKSVNKDGKSAELNINGNLTGSDETVVPTVVPGAPAAAPAPVSAPMMRSNSTACLNSNVESSAAPIGDSGGDGGKDEVGVPPKLYNAVEMMHVIRLYHPIDDLVSPSLKKPVVAEVYDEIVIPNPSAYLLYCCQLYGASSHAALTNARPYTVTSDLYEPFPSELDNLEHLTVVYNFIKEEIESKTTSLVVELFLVLSLCIDMECISLTSVRMPFLPAVESKRDLLYKDVQITQLKYGNETTANSLVPSNSK